MASFSLYSEKTRRLIHAIRSLLRRNRIDLRLSSSQPRDEHGVQLHGFFIAPNKRTRGKICVHCDSDESIFLHTLIHEFCHFLYWRLRRFHPGRTYYEQEFFVEVFAEKILCEFSKMNLFDTRRLRKIRRISHTYLRFVRNL
jgi:hypothetical protein